MLPGCMAGFLIVNPRSGDGDAQQARVVVEAAQAAGIRTHVLEEAEDVAALARTAADGPLGIAGGDGSLADVAAVALERDVPFVCIPFGTRNHFARDLGLNPDDPVAALEAFRGSERRIDVGRAGDRLFLNNVALGLYARLVHGRESVERARQGLATLRALGLVLRRREPVPLRVDGRSLVARVVVVANNAYRLDAFAIGERDRLDEGKLHLYSSRGLVPGRWAERAGERFEVDSEVRQLSAAVDGEPAELGVPIQFRVEPRALRVLVPGPPG
jgi:diacylglycerol kinase family enzyme